ncbi:MAG TPA: elongation factor G [Gaiellaceae bacterium]|nr:elongation factor G [Gaiellaceae bacterium]
MPYEPAKIRNVAVVGHRGTGKTSLLEAMLFQAGKTNRLGAVEAGTTVGDWDEDEQRRQMSLASSLAHLEWQGRKINLVDTPGDSGFQADTIASLRVVEGALVVVSAVMGVEVTTTRVWSRAEALGLSRVVFANMLDRERADFFRTLAALQAQLSDRCVAVELPIGAEHELTGIVDLLHNCAYMDPGGAREGDPVPVPAELEAQAAEYREKLLDAVVEIDEALMERYLGGEELEPAAVAAALKTAVTNDELYPVACGVATKNLGTHALLDLLVEGVPSPVRKPSPLAESGGTTAFVFKTVADPFAGRISAFRVYSGTVSPDSTLVNLRDKAKERVGSLMMLQGKEHERSDGFGAGDIGAVAKLKDVQTGDVLADSERALEPPRLDFPEPVMSFAVTPKTKGDEDKVAQALRRLHEEDPTLQLRRDPQTGEQLLSGMSQVHVEVAVGRLKSRFGVEVDLHQPRVPYVETIKSESRAQGRYKKQTGGRGQFGDCHIVIEPLEGHVGYEFVDEIVGGVIPQGFRPAVDKGIQEAMAHGDLAGAPVQGVRVRLVDGSYHTVDSSEMAFKVAGSLAFRSAYEKAQPTLLEPIMQLEVTVPDDAVGAVNGDLNSRRGRLQGMEPAGGMTTIRAEVPMAEVLTYSQSLTSMTGGRGDYHMEFLRYEEVPAHIAQKLIEAAKKEKEAVPA